MIQLHLVRGQTKLAITLLLLLVLVTTLVFPSASLAPTALRAARVANMLLAILALAGTVLAARGSRTRLRLTGTVFRPHPAVPGSVGLIDLNCARLC
jgi:hypothetical protein